MRKRKEVMALYEEEQEEAFEGFTHCPWCGAKLRWPLDEPPPPLCEGDPLWHERWQFP